MPLPLMLRLLYGTRCRLCRGTSVAFDAAAADAAAALWHSVPLFPRQLVALDAAAAAAASWPSVPLLPRLLSEAAAAAAADAAATLWPSRRFFCGCSLAFDAAPLMLRQRMALGAAFAAAR